MEDNDRGPDTIATDALLLLYLGGGLTWPPPGRAVRSRPPSRRLPAAQTDRLHDLSARHRGRARRVTVREDATGTTITSQGRLGAPLNVVTRRAEMKYTADGTPERFTLGRLSQRRRRLGAYDRSSTARRRAKALKARQRSRPRISFRRRQSCCRTASSVLRGTCRRLSQSHGRCRAQRLRPAAGRNRRPRRRDRAGADSASARSFLNVQRYDLLFNNPAAISP